MKQQTRPRFTFEADHMFHRTWVLVADQSGGRIFRRIDGEFEIVDRVPHPEGRLHANELGTDEPGTAYNSMGSHLHALVPENSQEVHLSELFAKRLATLLDKGRSEDRFNELVLIAGPKFLGTIKGAVSDGTRKLITETIEKDFARLPTLDLAVRLREIVPLNPAG